MRLLSVLLVASTAAVACTSRPTPQESAKVVGPVAAADAGGETTHAERTATAVPGPRPAAVGGAFVPKRLVEEKLRVRYMYREAPDRDGDSGWRFFSGDESQDFVDDPNNLAIYNLTTIVAIDPDVSPLLGTPPPCAFERRRVSEPFKRVPPPTSPR